MSNFYKYSYFKKSGKADNEVSEIQEEPDEDYEENFSKILTKVLDFENPIQTEAALEIEEINNSVDINIFDRGNLALSDLLPSSGQYSAKNAHKKITPLFKYSNNMMKGIKQSSMKPL